MRHPFLASRVAVALATVPATLAAQSPDQLREAIRTFRESHETAIVRELAEWLALPNVASDDAAIRKNADRLMAMLRQRGITTRLLESPGSPPAVFGELKTPGATKTVVFYSHYDGQPVDSGKWATPPWKPVLRSGSLADGAPEIPLVSPTGHYDPESRLYARSASDDKSPIIAMLWALDALRQAGTGPSVNLKFFFEGEEEAGSTHLREMLTRHRDVLGADLWIFCDGPVHQSRALQVVFGVRGDMGVNLTTYGPLRPLHSGHYGNWAPNPDVALIHLLASMRDGDGRITIAGYYGDVDSLTDRDRAAFRASPPVEEQLKGELQLGRTEGSPASLLEQIALPALNVSGLEGGRTGRGSANVIVPEAHAFLDLRLVPHQTPERVRQLIEAHIRAQGFHIVYADPDSATRRTHPRIVRLNWSGGYPAARTSLDAPATQALLRAADAAVGHPLIRIPTLGGSLPLYQFVQVLGTPFAIVPIVNHDNNQHGEDENLRLRNLWDGIELLGGLMAGIGQAWRPIP